MLTLSLSLSFNPCWFLRAHTRNDLKISFILYLFAFFINSFSFGYLLFNTNSTFKLHHCRRRCCCRFICGVVLYAFLHIFFLTSLRLSTHVLTSFTWQFFSFASIYVWFFFLLAHTNLLFTVVAVCTTKPKNGTGQMWLSEPLWFNTKKLYFFLFRLFYYYLFSTLRKNTLSRKFFTHDERTNQDWTRICCKNFYTTTVKATLRFKSSFSGEYRTIQLLAVA